MRDELADYRAYKARKDEVGELEAWREVHARGRADGIREATRACCNECHNPLMVRFDFLLHVLPNPRNGGHS